MAYVAKILLFPIKSLDGLDVERAELLASGTLKYDREFAIVDEQGKFVNGKNNPKVHLLRSHFQLAARTLTLEMNGNDKQQVFNLDGERIAIARTLSEFLQIPVKLERDPKKGFPDDTKSPGPTIISTATIVEIASWFPELTIDDIRKRLRTNIEIGGVPAFWEDQLFAEPDNPVSFRIGNVLLTGINPCQRCIVPTRDHLTGLGTPEFTKIFSHKRQETLPPFVNPSQFNHFYRVAVNTRLDPSEAGKAIAVGDEVEIFWQPG